jgi:hypothetical protein
MSRTRHSPTITPTSYADDSQAMRAALRWLAQAGLRFTRPTRYQLKIGPLSFYPDKGTLYRDGDRQALPERGLPALQALLGNHQPRTSGRPSDQARPLHRSDRTRPSQPGSDNQDGHHDGRLAPMSSN